jgi:hypothetical protein
VPGRKASALVFGNGFILRTSVPKSEAVAASSLDEIRAASDRHAVRVSPEVESFIRLVEREYASEVDSFLERYRRDVVLRESLGPLLEETKTYLLWLSWVGWNAANLAPLASSDLGASARRSAPAMLAYCGLRLVDDGLDSHETYKGQHPTLVTFFGARPHRLSHAQCGAFSAFVGSCVFTFALERIGQVSGTGAATTISTLFERAAVGVLAEVLVGPGADRATYDQIVRRKAAAYNLMLYRPLLDGLDLPLRRSLTRVLGELDVLAQVINDLNDVGDDRDRPQLNAFHGVYEWTEADEEIGRRVDDLWMLASLLPLDYRDAVAAMLINTGVDRIGEWSGS